MSTIHVSNQAGRVPTVNQLLTTDTGLGYNRVDALFYGLQVVGEVKTVVCLGESLTPGTSHVRKHSMISALDHSAETANKGYFPVTDAVTGEWKLVKAEVSNWNDAHSWGNHANAGYLKSADLSSYATQTWVGQQGFVTGTPWTGMGYITSSALSGYATQTWVGQQGFVTGTPWTGMGYVTGTPWTALGYITSSALSGYATQTWVGQQGFVTGTPWTALGYITSSALSGYATQTWVGQQGFVTGTPWTALGYITSSALSGYATQTWVGQQGFVTGTPWTGMGYLTSQTYPGAGIAVSSGSAWGTSITATTVGTNLIKVANPSAVMYIRINADNTISLLAADALKTALGYLTSADISGYATQTWVGQQGFVTGTPWTGMGYVTGTPWTALGYITSSALSGYATQTWVGQQGFVTGTPWTAMGYVTGTPWTGMGYLTSQTSHADVVVDGDFGSAGIMRRGSSSGSYSIISLVRQTLTAANPCYWNINNGVNAYINLNTTTWLEFQNLDASNAGLSGNLHIANASGAANNLTFGGTSAIAIAPNIQYNPSSPGDRVIVSGNSKNDVFSWYWDGSILWINGTLSYT